MMKKNLLSCLFCLIAFLGKAQSLPAQIYIVKNGAQTLGPLQLYTTLAPNQAIVVKNNGYVLIETDADSLGFFRGTAYADPEHPAPAKKLKPAYLQLEPGKKYYFKMGSLMYNQHIDVEEMTERAFQLYIGLNELNDKPRTYTFSSLKFGSPQ